MTRPESRTPVGDLRDVRLSKDPWERTPTDELQDQVLPRWFVLLAIAAVVAALVTVGVALSVVGRGDVAVAARRPPPGENLTHDVGAFETGSSEPVTYDEACRVLEGVRVAGSPGDRGSLRRGLAAVCNVADGELARGEVAEALEAFADAGGVVRFAVFEATGVDSAATLDGEPPQILVNARFSRSNPLFIAPLVAHDVIARTDPGDAVTEVAARRGEAEVCERLFSDTPPSCADALALVELSDPVAALRDVGYR